jgi:hypothetical protein
MQTITESRRKEISNAIVREFGNGELVSGHYLFEQVTRLPAGFVVGRLKPSVAVARLRGRHDKCLVIFDPHLNNARFVSEVVQVFGLPVVPGVVASLDEVEKLLSFDNCDMYVTNLDGRLLMIGCHENEVSDGEQFVWVPLAGEDLGGDLGRRESLIRRGAIDL